MRRLTIFLSGLLLLAALTLLSVQNATSAPNPTPSPTRTPTATRTDAPAQIDLKIDRIYYHSTGLFSIPRLVGWEPRPLNDNVHVPALSDDFASIYVDFVNDPALSGIRVALEKPASVRVASLQDLSRYVNNQYLQNNFREFERGWQETGRTISSNQLTINLNLHSVSGAVNYDYVARMIARIDHGWIIYLQMLAPANNPQLLNRMQQILLPTLTFYPAEAALPLQWATLADTSLGYMFRYPSDWFPSGHEGQEFAIDGFLGTSYISLTSGVDQKRSVKTEQDARKWVTADEPDAKFLTVRPETIKGGKGFSVSFTYGSSNNNNGPRSRISFGAIQTSRPVSAVATLLNGDNGNLYWLVGISSLANLDLLDVSAKTVPPQFAQIRSSFMLLPKTVFVAPSTQKVATSTLPPTATLDPQALDMSSAKTYKAPSGLFELKLPAGWQAQSTRQAVSFRLGNTPVDLTVEVDRSENIYGQLFSSARKSFDSPQAALQAFKEQAQLGASVTYGEVHPARIGTRDGYALSIGLSTGQTSPATQLEVRIALLPSNQAVETLAITDTNIAEQVQPVLDAMIASIVVNVPDSGPTHTPPPILLTATDIQRQVHELTETSTPTITPSPTATLTPTATSTSTPTYTLSATTTPSPTPTVTPTPNVF